MLERVIEIIKETYKKKDLVVDADTNLLDDLELNSLEVAELVCAFEDEFEIDIPDRAISGFRVVNDIAQYIENIN